VPVGYTPKPFRPSAFEHRADTQYHPRVVSHAPKLTLRHYNGRERIEIIRVMGTGHRGGVRVNYDDERKQTRAVKSCYYHVKLARNPCHYLSFTIMALLHGHFATVSYCNYSAYTL
jgi:hypothetical protein